MGLLENRALIAFQEYTYPRLEREIHDRAGFEVPVEIEWHTLAEKGMAHMYVKSFNNVYFIPLIQALQHIAVDELGVAALRENLLRIVIRNGCSNFESEEMATFEDGVLVIDHAPHSNVDDIKQRVQALIELLESEL